VNSAMRPIFNEKVSEK